MSNWVRSRSGTAGDGGRGAQGEEVVSHRGREAFEKVKALEERVAVGVGRGIGQGGRGGDQGEVAQGHVGEQERELLGRARGERQAATFNSRKVLADGVDLGDGGA